jgi:hypothetical protein
LEVGLFDEAFQMYGNEDLEFCWRLRQAGVTLSYASQALAYQHYSKDFAALARDTIAKGKTAVLLASKHPDAVPELQLSAYDQASWRWRSVRAVLLTASRLCSSTPEKVIAIIHHLERRRDGQLHLYYRFALDYMYWLGARTALRENRQAGRGLTSLVSRRET